jgi:hypothetical protein
MNYYSGNYFEWIVAKLQKMYPKHKLSYTVNDPPKCSIIFDECLTSVKISSSVPSFIDPSSQAFGQEAHNDYLNTLAEHLCQWRFQYKNTLRSDAVLLGKWWEGDEFKAYFEKKRKKLFEESK